jgi:hypothetical protein
MATVTNQLQNIASQEVASAHAHLAALGHKQAHVTFATLGTLLLVVVMMLTGGFFALRSYDRQLDKADARYEQVQEHEKILEKKLEDSNKQIQDLSAQQAQKTIIIDKRDKTADQKIADATKPDKTAEDVTEDAKNYLGTIPKFVSDGNLLAFKVTEVQGFVATKIDRDRLFGDLTDTKAILVAEKQKTTTLTGDKVLLQTQLDEANGSLKEYRKVAHKGKFKKFLGGATKVGLVLGGIWLGHQL